MKFVEDEDLKLEAHVGTTSVTVYDDERRTYVLLPFDFIRKLAEVIGDE